MGTDNKMMWARPSDLAAHASAAPKRRNSEDEDDLVILPNSFPPKKPYQVFEAVRQQQITTFYLTEVIGAPSEYIDIIQTLRTAQPQDIINFHLNTPGGRLDTGMQLINAMKVCEGRVVAVLDSKAHSLGTLLFLAADEFVVHDDCMFMIHNFSSTIGGKGNEQESELLATLAWFRKLAHKYYVPFLTVEELQRVLDGKDMWMDSDEVRMRLERMVFINGGGKFEDFGKKPRNRKAKTATQSVSTNGAGESTSELLASGILPAATTKAVSRKKSTK